MDTIPQKHCNGCDRDLPPTLQYFSPQKQNKDHLSSQCKQCNAARTAEYRKNNPEKIKAHTDKYKASGARKIVKARYDAKHRDERIQYSQQWHEQHREDQRIYYAEYNATHYKERLELGKRLREEHRDERREKRQQYRQTAHGRMVHSAHENKRRARKLEAAGIYTAQDIQVQHERQKGKCYYCRSTFGKGKNAYHVDHIVPLSRGGTNEPSNLVLACPLCNTRKNNKLLHEWEGGGRLL